MVLDLASKDKRVIVCFTAVWGWMTNLFLLDTSFLTWEFFLRGAMGLAISTTGVFLGVVVKDFYELKVKDKLYKTKKHGKDHSKAA